MLGRIFDIEEFCVYDGPGIRTVVFLKGCPLKCAWCHNPEGLDPFPSRITNIQLCTHCGACESVCKKGEHGVCTACGACVSACPKALISIKGEKTDAETIAGQIIKNKDILMMNGGGVTISGGEPLMQPDFAIDLARRLRPLHTAIETSGYADENTFLRVIGNFDYVIMDLKIINDALHRKYTSVSNRMIIRNLSLLKESGIPFRINIPLIPGVNDTLSNMEETGALLEGAKNLDRVCLLPYNRAAGAKYKSVGKKFDPPFDESIAPSIHLEPFLSRHMEVTVL